MTLLKRMCTERKRNLWIAAALLTLLCLFWPQQAQAASAPKITLKAVSNLTATNAQINASISNPSKVRLKKCGFILYNSAGKQLANLYDSINYTLSSFNGWFDLNDYYGKLQAGTTYKYKFYVMNASGSYYYSSLSSFTTKKAPSVTLKAVSGLTSSNAQINASISNPAKLKLVRCGYYLYSGSGAQLSHRYDTISYTLSSFNGWFDLNTYYGTLKPSTSYKYKIYVMDSAGNVYSSATSSFTTKSAPSSQTGTSGTKRLGYTASKITAIGPQPSGSVYCSVYAISYARAVAGKTPYSNPYAYWTKDGAKWSLGGMTSTKYATQQSGLKKLYSEIQAGRPAIAFVYGPGASQHYVTVIGYKDVTNANNLKMSNFIILDPGSASEKSMGAYTGLKMTTGNKGYQIVVF